MSYLLITAGATVLAYSMAKTRGRDTTLAIVGGLLFGLFSPLYYLIVGDSPALRRQKILDELMKSPYTK